MKRLGLVFLLWGVLATAAVANNVRIVGDVQVKPEDVDNSGIATIRLKIQWDNSWRDAFNYDGVYLFLKYKLDGEGETWHHVHLAECDSITEGYEAWMNTAGWNSATQSEGLFIYRTEKGFGNPTVGLRLRWNIHNSERNLIRDNFVAGDVFLSAMAIEMVYIPTGPFRIGDTQSKYAFKNLDVPIPADKDILSDKYCTYSSSTQMNDSEKGAYPPDAAANKVNEPGTATYNAWVGRSDSYTSEYWQVTFTDAPRIIKNIAIEGISGYRPTVWALKGASSSSGQWHEVYRGTQADWQINSQRTYPCTHAIEIPDTSTAYTNYRIEIIESSERPVIKNVAMTTENLFKSVDHSFLIYQPSHVMYYRWGIYADDGENYWSGSIGGTYPIGYRGFWTMKYEISQEQYVTFLNKLTFDQQKVRTIGSRLESLQEGQYVFGPFQTKPSARNGIKLAALGTNGDPSVFANDLDATNEYGQDSDGQTLACNFLNAGDMLAYADWCGLRPLSEMEFEKMARRPYPEPALWKEYAWNTNADYAPATIIVGAKGSKTEKPNTGSNVNAGGKLNGPLRCGAFAANGGGQLSSGASFWGVMELSGNLAELYYNANTEGRAFRSSGNIHHGDGTLSNTGAANVSLDYWPMHQDAFALRGGSFLSEKDELAISDRSKHWGLYASVDEISTLRDSTVTFRLGRTKGYNSLTASVTMANGTTNGSARDTICSGGSYTITGSVPKEITGAYRVAWFVSEDSGSSWMLLEGEEEPSLTVHNLRNVGREDGYFKEYRYMYAIFSDTEAWSYVARVWVINHEVTVNRLKDTVDIYDHSDGIVVTTKQPATFKWYWVRPSGNKTLAVQYAVSAYQQVHYFKYRNFSEADQSTTSYENQTCNYDREEKIVLETTVMERCSQTDTIDLFLRKSKESNNLAATGAMNESFRCGDVLIDNNYSGSSARNGARYKTVRIGNQCWMAENLRQTGSHLCYGNNSANCENYGYLYNWNVAVGSTSSSTQGICPTGWHVPTASEWNTLYAAVGNNARNLKSQLNNWGGGTYNTSYIGTNSSRFSALSTGVRVYNQNNSYYWKLNTGFYYQNDGTWWWTSNNITTNWGLNSATSYGQDCAGNYNYNGRCLNGNLPMVAYLRYNNAWDTDYYGWMVDLSAHGGGYSYSNSVNYFKSDFYLPVRCLRNSLPAED